MARVARGRGRGGRRGRGSRAGRGRGRGLESESAATWESQETTQERVADSQAFQEGSVGVTATGSSERAGGASVGPDVAGGAVGPGEGATVGVAPDRDDRLAGLLQMILERLPGGVPAPGHAPGVQPGMAGVQPGMAGVQPGLAGVQPGLAGVQPGMAGVEELPSYLRMMEQMQRIGTAFFSGGARPEEADGWRMRLERNFRSIRCPEGYRVDLAVHYLEGDAHLWWRGVEARRVQAEMVWEDFLAEFNAKYFPQEAVDRLESRFLDLTQGDRSVREFDLEFSRLLVHAGRGMEGEDAQVRRFLRGLRPDLRTRCRASRFATRAELVEMAAAIEEDLGEQVVVVSPPVQQQQPRRSQQQVSSGRGGKPAQGQKRKWESTSGASQGGSGCFGCGSMSHRVASCPRRTGTGTRDVRVGVQDTRVCYHCRETGHIKPKCPKLQQLAVAAVQPLAVQPLSQIAAAPRVFTSAEAGGSSTRPITGISELDFLNSWLFEFLFVGKL